MRRQPHRASGPVSASESRRLLEDGSLTLDFDPRLRHMVERWLPRLPHPPASEAATRGRAASIGVRLGESAGRPKGADDPLLRLGNVRAWSDEGSESVALAGESAACGGEIDLRRRRAEIWVEAKGMEAEGDRMQPENDRLDAGTDTGERGTDSIGRSPEPEEGGPDPIETPFGSIEPRPDPTEARTDPFPRDTDLPAAGEPRLPSDLYSMLTISAAMLVGRLGRALVHGAGVVPPGGNAWLIVGDAKSGKSTTCANLIAAGWDYVSDDQVVLRKTDSGETRIEGWPRDFHLDEGWGRGTPTGRRRAVDASSLGPGRWRRMADLSGILLTRVTGAHRTELWPARPGDALAALIRQAPWLLADPPVAPLCLEVLRGVAARPAFQLVLGRDTFHDPGRLAGLLPLEDAVGEGGEGGEGGVPQL